MDAGHDAFHGGGHIYGRKRRRQEGRWRPLRHGAPHHLHRSVLLRRRTAHHGKECGRYSRARGILRRRENALAADHAEQVLRHRRRLHGFRPRRLHDRGQSVQGRQSALHRQRIPVCRHHDPRRRARLRDPPDSEIRRGAAGVFHRHVLPVFPLWHSRGREGSGYVRSTHGMSRLRELPHCHACAL